MKRVFSYITAAFKVAAGVNILISLVFFVFSKIYTTSLGITEIGLKFDSFLLILAFSALIGALSLLFKASSLHFWMQVAIHYALLLLSFFLLFSLSGKIYPQASTVFVFLILFTVAYAIVMVITFLLKRALGGIAGKDKKEKKNESYKSMF